MITMILKNNTSVKIAIARNGKSLREFSKQIGISHPYLSQILNEKRNPSPATAKKIAEGLLVRVEDIFLIESVAKDNPEQTKEIEGRDHLDPSAGR